MNPARKCASAQAVPTKQQFAAQIFAFIRGITIDHRLLAVDIRVGTFLADHFNRLEQGRAFPMIKTIRRAVGVSDHSVIRSIRRLNDTGHLMVVFGKPGRGHPNHYFMTPEDVASPRVRELRQPRHRRPENPPPVQPFESRAPIENPPPVPRKPPTHAVEPLKRTTKERKGSKRASHARGAVPDFVSGKSVSKKAVTTSSEEERNKIKIDDGFARFWSVYPRKISEDDARAAFGRAIEAGADIEAVIARAVAYAVERAEAIRNGDNPKWTPYPATWLKKGNFKDPLPPGAVIDQDGNQIAIEHEQQHKSVYERCQEMAKIAYGGKPW